MKPSDILILEAFLVALSHLDKPLPTEIQKQLNQIGAALKLDSNNLGNLDLIAESYQPLDTLYQKKLTSLKSVAAEKNKGLPPEPLPNEPTPEIINTARDVFSADDSVVAAKKAAKPKNLLKRIWQFFTGSN
jgi:hypothetical protein